MTRMMKAIEEAKNILIEKLEERDLRRLIVCFDEMVSVVEIGDELKGEIRRLRHSREIGVGPFHGEKQTLVIYTEDHYLLHLEAVHAVQKEIGKSAVVVVWEEEGKVHASRVVYGRIDYFGPERRQELCGTDHTVFTEGWTGDAKEDEGVPPQRRRTDVGIRGQLA
jgi:hypothetical protein